ncbi:MAG: gliding motility lipoprotein GldD [Bacteroidota bacterium]|nr:gliding motility lipoprotein GldD [Bacteroidota bacterium]
MNLSKLRLTKYLIPVAIILASCSGNPVPKPRGYYRIDLPAHHYQHFDTTFPFAFEYPVYSKIVKDSSSIAEPYWINIVYLPFHAQLHISYKPVHKNLATYLDDAHTLVNKHIPKANAIGQQAYENPSENVYGLVYEIRGSGAASPFQFYLTDSTRHFVRGALYFDLVPNNDSLAPVIDFLKEDIRHMINTFHWKNQEKTSSLKK